MKTTTTTTTITIDTVEEYRAMKKQEAQARLARIHAANEKEKVLNLVILARLKAIIVCKETTNE
jgi:hypothetical protein